LDVFAPLYVPNQNLTVAGKGMNKDNSSGFVAVSEILNVNTFWLFIGLQTAGVAAGGFSFQVYFLKEYYNSSNVQWTSLDPSDNSGWTLNFANNALNFTYSGTELPKYLPWVEMKTTSNPVYSGMALTAANSSVYPQAVFAWTDPFPSSPGPSSRVSPSSSPSSRVSPSSSPSSRIPPSSSPSALAPGSSRPPASIPNSPSRVSPSVGLPVWAIVVLVVAGVALVLGLGLGLGLRKAKSRRTPTIKPE
jgi:hypothetical protein